MGKWRRIAIRRYDGCRLERLPQPLQGDGVMEWWSDGWLTLTISPTLQHSITPTLSFLARIGFSGNGACRRREVYYN
jgi:hypothetical protein